MYNLHRTIKFGIKQYSAVQGSLIIVEVVENTSFNEGFQRVSCDCNSLTQLAIVGHFVASLPIYPYRQTFSPVKRNDVDCVRGMKTPATEHVIKLSVNMLYSSSKHFVLGNNVVENIIYIQIQLALPSSFFSVLYYASTHLLKYSIYNSIGLFLC